ncbi:alpha/beta hydrolase [Kitasatospora sp. NPDC097643]|uniref:alpha/beta hydrolase n=1 Tax=Kitasatospora sp. NPDC097643 TaxID=3157230 RepID=UPI00332DF386
MVRYSAGGQATSTYELLVKFDPHGLHDAAKAWKALGHAVESTGERHRNQVNGPLCQGWEGDDAIAALPFMVKTEQQLDIVRTESEAAALVLNTVADRMYQAQTNLINAVNRAVDAGLVVSATGVVDLPPDHNDPDAQEARRKLAAERKGFQDRIDTALKDAETASEQGHNALVRLSANTLDPSRANGSLAEAKSAAAGALKDLGLVDPYIPDGKDPAKNAAWWNGLTQDQRETYLALNAAKIGNLDGLPATVRDEANRLVLDQKIDAMMVGSPSTFGLDQAAYDKRKAALTEIKKKLEETADTKDESKQMFLLAIEPEAHGGDGRAIVATGNPDKATHTAVFVPGTNTDLNGVPGQIDHVRRLQDAAKGSTKAGETVSVISYLGYDAPESIPGAASPTRGIDGADDMRRFSNGLRVSHGEPKTHLTYVAHSYGSFAVGVAASEGGGLHADDIIALGSPGMGVGNADRLNIDPDHVWIGEASNDLTRLAFSTTLGVSPHTWGFGGHNIVIDTQDHGGYWNPGSESLLNQAKIIANQQPTTTAKELPLAGNVPR